MSKSLSFDPTRDANAENLKKIADEFKKPWYKTALGWFAFLAILAAVPAAIFSGIATLDI